MLKSPAGTRTIPERETITLTVSPDETDVIVGWVAQRASAFTVYDPPTVQVCDALVPVPHEEYVPSPQLNRYSTA
jgi:hypothetical protein